MVLGSRSQTEHVTRESMYNFTRLHNCMKKTFPSPSIVQEMLLISCSRSSFPSFTTLDSVNKNRFFLYHFLLKSWRLYFFLSKYYQLSEILSVNSIILAERVFPSGIPIMLMGPVIPIMIVGTAVPTK